MPGYQRFPALSAAHLAFVCEDCLWIAPREGGLARRLTTDLTEVRRPFFSPDGSMVAFLSNAEGTFEVYVVPVDGGVPQRLTFEGANTGLMGFTPSGKVLFRSSRNGAFRTHATVYEVDIDGARVAPVPVGFAMHVSFAPDGDTVAIGRNATDNAYWKRYRGGTVGEVWLGSLSKQTFSPLQLAGNPVLPVIVGERVFYLSDEDGFGNVWSVPLGGGESVCHTSHRDHYARMLSAHEGTLAYQCGARIWMLESAGGDSRPIEVETRPSGAQLRRRFVEPGDHLQDAVPSPDAKLLACVVRGKLLTMAPWGGAVRVIGERSGVRYRHPVWLDQGRRLVAISDQGGEEAPELFDAETGKLERRVPIEGFRRMKRLLPNPVRSEVVAIDASGKVALLKLDAKENDRNAVRMIEESSSGAVTDPVWSPDGRYLAYVVPIGFVSGGILRLHDTESGESHSLTTEEIPAHSPAFDPHGRFLYFVSERTFKPVFSPITFDASVPVASRLYALVLSNDQISPFDPRFAEVLEADEKEKEERERKERTDDTKEKPPPVRIDVDGLADRIVTFPDIEVGTYDALQAADGKVLFLSYDMEVDESEKDAESLPDLVAYDMRTTKQTTVLPEVKRFQVCGEKTLIWSEKSTLHLLETGEEPPKEPPQEGCNRHTGQIDLDRLRIEIVPSEEWRQMFLEAWRLQRDHFWAESMAGIDWPAIRERYLPLLDRVATRSELSDLIWELQGELGTSHAYESGGDYPDTTSYPVGSLGADFRWDGKGYVVERIPEGDAWDIRSASPLRAPGVNIFVGDRVVSVGGRQLREDRPPATLLVHEASSDIEIGIEPASGGDERRVVVRTLGSEQALRYRDWVRRKREHVTERSGDRLGYLHLPNMSGVGLAEFYRAFRSQSKRPGLVVDVRNNGGGFVSQLLIEHLRRKVIGYDRPRYGRVETYPVDAVRGPIVAVCDQFAGSDGDIFCHAFRRHEIGPLIGTRTWGGVIGIDLDVDKMLADGTVVTQPEYSSYFDGVGWDVENHGVEPDIVVPMDPASMVSGEDPQLDRAIDVALERLEESPIVDPQWPDVPSRRF